MKKGVEYDYEEAYNKNLKPSARLHYLENARHDQDSPAEMGHKSPAKMGHKSPVKKYGSPMEKHCTPMKKYKSPMKMSGHVIHKHMGGAPFHKAGNPDLEYMPVVKDATGQRPGVSSLVYDPLHKPAVSLGKQDLKVSSKKPSFAKPTRSELRKSKRADRIEHRIKKKQDIGARKLEAGNKIGARDKARRVARMQKRVNRLK